MDAKFERALKSLNFTDDCMAHPIVEQFLYYIKLVFINWRNTQRETCRRLGIETTG